MTDKEVEIIDGVIRGILAFLSNPKNEDYYLECVEFFNTEMKRYIYEFLWLAMNADDWLNSRSFLVGSIGMKHWQQCVDHALMILSMEYQYEG